MTALDKQPTKVEHPKSAESHLHGVRDEVQTAQMAQQSASRGSEPKGLQSGVTHLDMSTPFAKPAADNAGSRGPVKPEDHHAQAKPGAEKPGTGGAAHAKPEAHHVHKDGAAKGTDAEVNPGNAQAAKAQAADHPATNANPQEQLPAQPGAGSAWDVRQNFNVRDSVGKTMMPSDSGGTDSIQNKPSAAPSANQSMVRGALVAGDAVTKWNGPKPG